MSTRIQLLFEMRNGRIDKYLFEGGYAQATASGSNNDSFAFYYYNQDHLGNIREVVDASGTVQQVTNYYPKIKRFLILEAKKISVLRFLKK